MGKWKRCTKCGHSYFESEPNIFIIRRQKPHGKIWHIWTIIPGRGFTEKMENQLRELKEEVIKLAKENKFLAFLDLAKKHERHFREIADLNVFGQEAFKIELNVPVGEEKYIGGHNVLVLEFKGDC